MARISGVLLVVCAGLLLTSSPGLAHCDGMDGPVVKAAQKALETADVNLVLIWVQERDEPEIRKAFEMTLAVRKIGGAARELADRYFFETLVRIHRAGEGAPYTGLKPAGRDLGPAIPAADKAIEDGSVARLQEILSRSIGRGIEQRFKDVMAKKKFDRKDVVAGREFVKAYVEFIHYAEGIYQASAGPIHGHFPEVGESGTIKTEH